MGLALATSRLMQRCGRQGSRGEAVPRSKSFHNLGRLGRDRKRLQSVGLMEVLFTFYHDQNGLMRRWTSTKSQPYQRSGEREKRMKKTRIGLELNNLQGDRKIYDLFLVSPSVGVLPLLDQYVIYGRTFLHPVELEPVRIFDRAQEAMSFCQKCNESRKEIFSMVIDS